MPHALEATTAGLRLQLMGGFRAWVDGREVPAARWRLRRAREVVALLALARDHRVHREGAVETLWPEGVATPANSLNQVLFVARRALDPRAPRRFLVLDGDLVSLAGPEPVAVDVAEFEAAVREARRAPSAATWGEAARRYAGDLLPEAVYIDWIARRRQGLQAAAVEVFGELAAALTRAGDPAGAAEALARRADVDGGAEVPPPPRLARQVPVPGEGRQPGHNIPAMLSTFVGRESQLADLDASLERSRLLTLSGPGGAGKTRLACEIGRRVLPRYPEGVWFVDLGAISDSSLVLTAMCEGLAIRPRPGDSPLAAVLERLRQGPVLLLVDNCEHLLGACAEYVETLLRECPELTVIATSREPLRVAGEMVWRTPSLTLPAPTATPAELLRTEAVRLFADRAGAVDPGFAITEAGAADVARLCRRLDGLPLAIELAAARMGSLSAAELLERLDARFGLLNAGSRTAMTRQQTLAATLDWSHDLLAESHRAVLRRLSVFAGGFELGAAEAVCALPPVAAGEIAGVVAELVDKSLVAVGSVGGRRRHRLLDTIREYGRGRLAEAGELEAAARRHALWCLELAERAEPQLSTHEEPRWLRRLEGEVDNLRAALGWAVDRDAELHGRLTAALGLFWLRRLRLVEALRWIDPALERTAGPTLLRARLICARAAIEIRRTGDTGNAAGVAEAIGIARTRGDPLLEGRSLLILGAHELLTLLDAAFTTFRRARDHGDATGLPQIAAAALAGLAVAHGARGEDEAAESAALEALERTRRLADAVLVPGMVSMGELVGPRRETGGRVRAILEETMIPFRELPAREAEAHVVAISGVLARMRGDPERAERLLGRAHAMSLRLRDRRGVADNLERGGELALATGELGRARSRFERALALRRGLGDARAVGLSTGALGSVALAAGDPVRARRLHDAAVARFRRAGDRPGMSAAFLHRGDLGLVTGDLGLAEADYELAGQQTARYRPWALFCRADVAAARGDVAAARELIVRVRDELARGHGRRARAACDARLADLSAR